MEFEYMGKVYETPLKQKIDGIYDSKGRKFLDGYELPEEIERLIIISINLAHKRKRFWFF